MSIVTVKHLSTADLQSRLDEFEHKYSMSTATFLDLWAKGELDGHDYVVWAGLSHLATEAGLLAKPHSAAALA